MYIHTNMHTYIHTHICVCVIRIFMDVLYISPPI